MSKNDAGRTRIGNTPTCALCGNAHGETECPRPVVPVPDWAEETSNGLRYSWKPSGPWETESTAVIYVKGDTPQADIDEAEAEITKHVEAYAVEVVIAADSVPAAVPVPAARRRKHPHVGVGHCKTCGHYGADCTGTKKPIKLGKRRRERGQQLLELARAKQTLYWAVLGHLEECLGVEIDSTCDLSNETLESLTDTERAV